jgi:hypothetical protein
MIAPALTAEAAEHAENFARVSAALAFSAANNELTTLSGETTKTT